MNLLVESPSIINGDPKSSGDTGEFVTVLILAEVRGDTILLLFLLRASEWMIDRHSCQKKTHWLCFGKTSLADIQIPFHLFNDPRILDLIVYSVGGTSSSYCKLLGRTGNRTCKQTRAAQVCNDGEAAEDTGIKSIQFGEDFSF